MNGNCIKFVNINDGSVSYLHAPGNGISALAVNPFHGLVAFGENGLNAKIFIYETKKLDKPICTIPGMKQLVLQVFPLWAQLLNVQYFSPVMVKILAYLNQILQHFNCVFFNYVCFPGSKASLGYKCIAFANNGTLLASCSNIPEVKLTLW